MPRASRLHFLLLAVALIAAIAIGCGGGDSTTTVVVTEEDTTPPPEPGPRDDRDRDRDEAATPAPEVDDGATLSREFRLGFISSCRAGARAASATGLDVNAYCRCTLEKLEATIPVKELTEFGLKALSDPSQALSDAPPELRQAITDCVGVAYE